MITTEMVVAAGWEMYADEYADGATIAEISRRAQVSSWTATERMKAAGVYQPGRKPGVASLDRCQRGHDMGEHRKPIKGGGWYCGMCKRLRERVAGLP